MMLQICISIFSLFAGVALCDKYEMELLAHLKKNYDGLVRPVADGNQSVMVQLHISLQQIVDVDEKDQIIFLNAWLNYVWKDYRLSWDPEKWGGVKDVRFKHGYLWKPDIMLYNSVDSGFDSSYPSNMVVYESGLISWIPPGIFQVSCPINIKWFPFDEQKCHLIFGSWSYDAKKLDLQRSNYSEDGFDMSIYVENAEWKIQKLSVERKVKCYKNGTDCKPQLYFYLDIRRRTLYYGFNLIIPGLVIVLMTILNFTLPPEAGEKITLSTTILLSVCFFLQILGTTLPQTSTAVPLLGAFYSCCMIVVSMAVVQSVVSQNFHFRTLDTHEMSHFTRSVLLYWLPWILRMKRPGYKFEWKTLPNPFIQRSGSSENVSLNESESLLRNIRSKEDVIEQAKGSPEIGRRSVSEFEEQLTNNINHFDANETSIMKIFHHTMCLMMQQAHKEIMFITKRLSSGDEGDDAENDWKFAAWVIDRLSLLLFSVSIIISSCCILFSAPYVVA